MVCSWSFLDSPKGALEFCDGSGEWWGCGGLWIGSCPIFLRIRSAIAVEDGDVDSTDEGGRSRMDSWAKL